jgi:ADP-ribose pyrophosphatase YjhB (NUDIX family)
LTTAGSSEPTGPENASETVYRRAVRVVIVDTHRRVLLLKTRNLESASHSTWSLPGGAVESGESPTEAAHRELLEETGISAPNIGESFAELTSTFVFNGVPYRQSDLILGVVLSPREVDRIGEHESLRWWHLADLIATGAPTFPETLPDLMEMFIGSEERRGTRFQFSGV